MKKAKLTLIAIILTAIVGGVFAAKKRAVLELYTWNGVNCQDVGPRKIWNYIGKTPHTFFFHATLTAPGTGTPVVCDTPLWVQSSE